MTNNQYFDYNNPINFLEKAKELEKVFNGFGYSLFLNAGTLLGCIRDNDLLPHDDDMDFFYISTKTHRKAVLNEFENIIRKELESKGWEVKPIYWRLHGPQIMMGQYHVIKDNISLDLWTGWYNKNNELSITMGIENIPTAKKDMFPPQKRTLRSYQFDVPANPELHLENLYGPNWKIPDPSYKIRCNKNFLQKSMLKVIDQFGWAYFFIAKAQQLYSYHNISYKRLQDMNDYAINEDVIYFHSPCMGNARINEIIKTVNRKKTKIIGAYGGENNGVYTEADLIVTISFPYLQKLKSRYPNKPCIFLPEAIDCEYFKNREYKQSKFDIGYVGRPSRVKRVHLLDKLKYNVKKQMSWGKNVFVEDRTLDEVRNFYKSIDCLVLTSQSECMPRVVLEAMAMGLPVVSTDVGCLRMLIEPEWIVPNGTEEEIVKNINDRLDILNKYPEIRKKVGIRNRKHIIKNFNWETVQQTWDEVINALVIEDYEKINKIGLELEEKYNKFYLDYQVKERNDLLNISNLIPKKPTKIPAIEAIYNLMPSVVCLERTCLSIIKGDKDIRKQFSFGYTADKFDDITNYLIRNGFTKLEDNKFLSEDYIVSLKEYNQRKKTYMYNGIQTNVPYPVVGYLTKLFGHNWKHS